VGCPSPFLRPWTRSWINYWSHDCDAWPVCCQTYSYLSSCRASQPLDQYQIMLLVTEAPCVQTTFSRLLPDLTVEWLRLEPATFELRVQLTDHFLTRLRCNNLPRRHFSCLLAVMLQGMNHTVKKSSFVSSWYIVSWWNQTALMIEQSSCPVRAVSSVHLYSTARTLTVSLKKDRHICSTCWTDWCDLLALILCCYSDTVFCVHVRNNNCLDVCF